MGQIVQTAKLSGSHQKQKAISVSTFGTKPSESDHRFHKPVIPKDQVRVCGDPE